jgi:hypothetical protein
MRSRWEPGMVKFWQWKGQEHMVWTGQPQSLTSGGDGPVSSRGAPLRLVLARRSIHNR